MVIWCICSALKELNAKKIVHRDIKLENILVTEDLQVKLADFGLSKIREGAGDMMKSSCGTPVTMAPEVLDNREYNETCDTWSLGVIAYQMVFRVPPFKCDTLAQMKAAVQSQEVEFPHNVKVSERFKNFIRRCLGKDFKVRPAPAEIIQDPWLVEGEILTVVSG